MIVRARKRVEIEKMKNPVSVADLTKAIKKASRDGAARRTAVPASQNTRSTIRKLRNETGQVLTQYFADSGLNLKKIEVLQKRLGAELERVAAQEKAAVLRHASAQRRQRDIRIAQRAKAAAALASGPALNVGPFVVLDTPFLIWSQPLLDFTDSNTAPFGSWVKFDFSTSDRDGTQSVNFYYYWQSPFTNTVTINAETFLSAVGHIQADAPWSLFSKGAQVAVVAMFSVGIGFDQQDPSPPQLDLGGVNALGTWIGGDSNGKPINSEVTLTSLGFAVPPGAGVVFEVSLAIWYNNDDGCHVDADFTSGDFRFTSPFVAFSIVDPPNPAWGVGVAPIASSETRR
jgi:hypothetical protein